MVKIIELKNRSHTFNLNDKRTLRLYAKQSVEISDSLAESPEIVGAVRDKIIRLEKVKTKTESNKEEKGGKK